MERVWETSESSLTEWDNRPRTLTLGGGEGCFVLVFVQVRREPSTRLGRLIALTSDHGEIIFKINNPNPNPN